MGILAAEPLAGQWWRDAESGVEPGVSYTMVLARGRPAAWAGWIVIDDEQGNPLLKCCNNYARRAYGDRRSALYRLAYRARHRDVVTQLGLPGVTYLFPEPIPLHLRDGWRRDKGKGARGTSRAVRGGRLHHWRRLLWTPPAQRPRAAARPPVQPDPDRLRGPRTAVAVERERHTG